MTRPLAFTEAQIIRAMRAIQKAGKFVVGVKLDGTLIVAEKPLDIASINPAEVHYEPASKWEDQRG
jgi:hypothetical protein